MLLIIYEDLETDYNVFLEYYYAKERVNEFLISLMFFIALLQSESRWAKSFSVFGFTVAFSSMIDKVFLENYDYLYSDIIILVLAVYLAYKTFKNGENPSRNQRPICKNNNTVISGDINTVSDEEQKY